MTVYFMTVQCMIFFYDQNVNVTVIITNNHTMILQYTDGNANIV